MGSIDERVNDNIYLKQKKKSEVIIVFEDSKNSIVLASRKRDKHQF